MAFRQANFSELFHPMVKSLGFKLWGCELLEQGKYTLLRVYIDDRVSAIDAPSNISVDECAVVSGQISALLEAEKVFSKAYCLEVSSPGEKRRLFNLSHYHRVVGYAVFLRLHALFLGCRRYRGQLLAVESETVVLNVDKESIHIPYRLIARGHVDTLFRH